MPTILYQRGKNTASRQRVFIAVPTYSGSVGAAFSMSMFEAIQILDAGSIAVDYCIQTGNCHVDDARNAMVREFIKTDCTDLVFIDEDVGFDGADLYRLCKHECDFVAGVYPCKQDETEFPVLTEPGKEIWSNSDDLVDAEAVPTGFLRMRRNVIEKMIEAFGERKFFGRGQENESPHCILFERTYEDGKRYSGDYSFCRKWKSIGGKIFVNPNFKFTHTGNKAWSGSLADYWRAKNGVVKKELLHYVTLLKNGNDGIDVFEELFRIWGNHWSAPPVMLKEIYSICKNNDGEVLECGSGLSTIVMAAAGKQVTSLENDSSWFGKVSESLIDAGVSDKVNVILSPITSYGPYQWYSNRVPDKMFGIVLCDGPERKYGREGLFLTVYDKIKGSTIIIDDTNDPLQFDLLSKYCENVVFKGRYSTGIIK